MTTIGFVLLTHSHPGQVLNLSRVLSELYGDPPIVCHHDFSQCPLSKNRFPANVRFVEPYFRTFWGCFSIVPAARAAIRLLMDCDRAPDWFYLLSGSDYPIASPERVLDTLADTPYDAFIDYREIAWRPRLQQPLATPKSGFSRSGYPALAYRRYCAVAIPRPSKNQPFVIPPVGHSYLYHPLWRTIVPGPFSEEFRCYAGEHWFTANRKAAQVLLTDTGRATRLLAHLRTRESPEECFYHTLLGNARLKLSTNNLRYIDWASPEAFHPRWLTVNDMDQIESSDAHFARKLAPGSPLAAELDRMLGVKQAA